MAQTGCRKTLPLNPLPLKVVYHTPCHMEKMGWTLYTLELLRQIPGLELTVLDSQCCGIAGTYGFKRKTIRHHSPSARRCSARLKRAAPTLSSPIVKPVSGKLRCLQANAANIPLRYWPKRSASKAPEPLRRYYPTHQADFPSDIYPSYFKLLMYWLRIILGINADVSLQ